MPGAARLLAELSAHEIPTALVSASHRRIIDRVLTSLGTQHFALTIAGDEVERTKPHPDPYLIAAAGLGVDPADAPSWRTRRPGSPLPRPRAALSWPYRPSRPSPPVRAAPS